MGLSMRFDNGMCIDPRILTRADKEKFVGSVFVCTCRKDIELKYSFRKGTLALYPKENRFAGEHSIFCDLNETYNKRSRCSALTKDDVTGELCANIKENILRRPIRYEAQLLHDYKSKKRPDKDENKESSMNLSALLKDINLEACYRQTQWMRYGNQKGYRSIPEFCKVVWSIAKDTQIKGKGASLAGNSLSEYGVRFDYCQLTGITKFEFTEGKPSRSKCSIITRDYLENTLKKRIDAGKQTYIALNYIANFGLKERSVKISPKSLYYGTKHFLNTYKMDKIDLEKDFISAGFYSYETGKYKDSSGKVRTEYTADRLILLLTNKYGVFSESRYEAAGYDAIMDFCVTHGGLFPYKPYRFTSNAYGGEYLEDMRILSDKGKDIVVEMFGMMDNEDYARKAASKEKYMDKSKEYFEFVPWYPQKEGTDILINRIKDIVS